MQREVVSGRVDFLQLARADAAELSQKLGVEESQAKRLIAKASQFGKRSA